MNAGAIARVTVRATIAPLVAEPRVSASQTSQLLRGHRADVLEQQDTWFRIRGADGYDGWCHAGYLTAPVTLGADTTPLHPSWSDEHRMSLGCTIRRVEKGAQPLQLSLPVGAFLDPDDVVVAGLAMNHRGRSRYFATDPQLLARRAVDLFAGTPYQWGGVTPWGADCSGFVQTMFALHGLQLPRDAWQQAEQGTPIVSDSNDWRAADLLFFSDRDDAKITHVAIALGGANVVHCSLMNGGYAIDTLTETTPCAHHLRATFRFAKRMF